MATPGWLTRRAANLAGFLACAAMMGFAFYEQYGVGLEPCNMCYLQRIAVVALGLVFLIAGLHDAAALGARLYGVCIAGLAAGGAAVAGRHLWMQLQPPGSLPSCGADFFTMLEMMPVRDVVTKILMGGGDCQKIVWSLFGLSMPGWVMIAVAGLGLAGLVANLLLRRGLDAGA